MSASAIEVLHARLRPMRRPWRSRLARQILGTTMAMAASSLVMALLALGPASEPGASLWVRAGGAGLLTAAVALALAGVLVRQVRRPLTEIERAVSAGWARYGSDASSGAWHLGADDLTETSRSLRRLLETLSDRIATNESLAADLAHEIRNPLTSLRSAAEGLRRSDAGQRARLIDIIEQDVARLDRLVGEISSASRLDAELVRERAIRFDLAATIRSLVIHLSHRAAEEGLEIISDLPAAPVHVHGLEPRLAQVIVNLIENAISLCEEGDAVRVWMRPRDKRVLVVIEDTGPGIPEGEAEKIFRRFYSRRTGDKPGDHLGLGLAISRQIVEAHDGVIWAENIRPTESDILSEPLGARFVVVLPL